MKVRKLSAILLAGTLMATPVVTSTAMAESSQTDSTQSIVDESGNLKIEGTKIIGLTEQGKKAKEIKIPEGVTYVGYEFRDCTNLESVDIPASVTEIVTGTAIPAFFGCTSLKSINVSKDNKTYCSEDGILYRSFDDGERILIRCPSGKSGTVSIPEGVTSITHLAFLNCSNVKSIIFSDSVNGIADYFPFSGCTGLESVNVSENNENFSSLDGVLFDKEKTEIILYPSNKSEKNYSVPDSVVSIDYCAIQNCTNLESITIPDSLDYIATESFSNCTSLKDVHYNGTKEQLTEIIEGDLKDFFGSATVHYNSTGPEVTPDTPSSSTPESSLTPESSSSSSSSTPAAVPNKNYSDAETNVSVSVPETLADSALEGASLAVEQIKNTDESSKDVTFDISFKDKDGKTVSLDNNTTEITVQIPVPEALKGEKNIYVYYVDDKGNYTDMKAVVNNDTIEFKTTHFSKYLITTDGSLAKSPNTGFGGIAVTLGIFALAGAAVIVAKKNH